MRIVLVVAIIILIGGISVVAIAEKDEENPMIGTWVMVSGVYYSPDGSTNKFSSNNTRQMKVINDSHFTTLWQDTLYNDNRGFNGGTYTYENGIYTEFLEYFTITDRIGDTAYFKVEINENTLNISACDPHGNISETGYFQQWERIE